MDVWVVRDVSMSLLSRSWELRAVIRQALARDIWSESSKYGLLLK